MMEDKELYWIKYLGLLNILLYLDGVGNFKLLDNLKISEIIEKHYRDKDFSPNNKKRLEILHNASDNDEYFSNTIIKTHISTNFSACLFYDNVDRYFLGFRGTKFNEWDDNVRALAGICFETQQQKLALSYFEKIIKEKAICRNDKLVIFGHSNGGLKAQYVLLNSKYRNLISRVYAYNSQKFAREAYTYYFSKISKELKEELIQKITLIENQGDVVHCFGNTENEYFIPESQIINFESNFKGKFRPHFAESIYTDEGELNKMVDRDEMTLTDHKTNRHSRMYMSLNPKNRSRIGNVIVSIFLFCRKIGIDKIIDNHDRKKTK